jgi:hypothetical protein
MSDSRQTGVLDVERNVSITTGHVRGPRLACHAINARYKFVASAANHYELKGPTSRSLSEWRRC